MERFPIAHSSVAALRRGSPAVRKPPLPSFFYRTSAGPRPVGKLLSHRVTHYPSVFVHPIRNMDADKTRMETPITAMDFLDAPVHSPLNAPQKVAAIIDMAEAMGQPMTSRMSPSMEPPIP